MKSLQPDEVRSFCRFIFGSVDRLVECLEDLSERELNWRPPAPNTNSLYAITMHVLGNIEENILGTLCGLPLERDRGTEFLASGASPKPVRQKWEDLKERIIAELANLPADALDSERAHPRRGTLTGRDVLIVVARHAAEHWGEAQLTRSLLKAIPDDAHQDITPRDRST